MSDSHNMNLNISATDTASPALRALADELAKLQAMQKLFVQASQSAAAEIAAAGIKQLESTKAQIQVIQAQINTLNLATQAARNFRMEAALGPSFEREINSASAAAGVLAKSLSAAAYSDSVLRDQAASTTAILSRQAAVMSALRGEGIASIRTQGPSVVRTVSGSAVGRQTAEAAGVKSSLLDATEAAAVFEAQFNRMTAAVVESNNKQIKAIRDTITAQKAQVAATGESFQQIINRTTGVSASGGQITAATSMFAAVENSTRGASREVGSFNQMIRHTIAAFDELVRGQRGAFFSTLGAAARDAGLGVNALIGSMGGLVAILAAGAIVKHTETLGKWAQQSLNVAQATGLTVSQYSQLEGALQQVGGKQGDLDAPLRSFVKALEQAQDPASKAAQAFHAMGIEQSTIASTSLTVYDKLMMVIDAFNHANESGNKAAAQLRLFGNEGEKLSPLFDRGAEATRKLMEAAKELGITLDEASARSMAEAGQKAEHLSLVLSGELTQAFIKAGPAIAHVTEVVGALAGAFSSILGKIDSAGEAIGRFVSRARGAESVRLPGSSVPGTEARGGGAAPGTEFGQSKLIGLGDIVSDVPLSQFQKQGAGARIADSGKFDVGPIIGAASVVQKANEEVKKSVAEVAEAYQKAGATATQANLAMANAAVEGWEKQIAAAKEAGATPSELAGLQLRLSEAQERASKVAITASTQAARQSYENFAAAEREKIAAADGSASAIIAIYQEWLQKAKSVYHQLPAELSKVQAEMERAASHAIVQKVRLEVEEIDRSAALTRSQEEGAKLDAQVTRVMHPKAADMGGDIASSQAAMRQIIADGEAMDAALKKEIATLEQQKQALIDSGQAGTAAFKEVTAAIQELQQKLQQNANTTKQEWLETFNQIQTAAKKAAEESSKAFTQFFSEVGSQLDSFASAMGKALLFPQQELIKAGLTTIHVNLRGEEIRAAFQKLVEGMAGDLFKGITNALTSAFAQSIGAKAGQGLSSFLGEKLAGLFGAKPAPEASGMPGANSQIMQPLQAAVTSADSALQKFTQAVQQAANSMPKGGGGGDGGGDGDMDSPGYLSQSDNNIMSLGANISNALSTTSDTTTEGISHSVLKSATNIVGAITPLQTILSAIQGIQTITNSLLMLLNLKPSVLGTTYAGGGVVSAAGGMVSGRAQLAILHDKEMVLPKHLSEGVQSMISRHGSEGGRSSSASLNYSPTINTGRSSMSRAELGSLLSSHSSTLIGEARNMIRRGWRP